MKNSICILMFVFLICAVNTTAQVASIENFEGERENCGYENFIDIPWLLDRWNNGYTSITAYENQGEIFFYIEDCSQFLLELQHFIVNCENEYVCGWGSFQDYGAGCPDFFLTANFVEVVYECVCIHKELIQPTCIENYMHRTMPICGCDGITYSDFYWAYCSEGIIQYTYGACGSEVEPCYENLVFVDLPLSGGEFQAQSRIAVDNDLINGKNLLLKAGEEVELGFYVGFNMSRSSNLQIEIGACD